MRALGGLAWAADDAADGDMASAPVFGLSARASYATRDWVQFEVAVSGGTTTSASYDSGHFEPAGRPPVDGAFDTRNQFARAELGASLRLGVRYIPRIRAFVGPQVRRTGATSVAGSEVRAAELGFDLVGGAGLGIDYRVGRRLVIGVEGAASYGVPLSGEALHTVEIGLHVSYYFYPR
jgi:hypothetical protein